MSRTTPTVHQEGLYDDAAFAWVARLRRPQFDEKDATEFTEWLRSDPNHAAAFDRAAALWELTGKIDADVHAIPKSAHTIAHGRLWFALAATLVVGVLGLTFLLGPETHRTIEGEQRLVELDDGSRIQLNTDTEVSVEVEAGGHRRVTVVRGEAFFDIASDPSHPFVVTSNGLQIEVLGTRFNVWRQDLETQVDVESGRVKVVPVEDLAAEIVLTDGQSVRGRSSAIESTATVANRLDRWRSGRVVYDAVLLGELVKDLDRYIPGSLSLSDEALASIEVSAVLRLSDETEMLDALTSSLDLTWSEVQGGLKLISARHTR